MDTAVVTDNNLYLSKEDMDFIYDFIEKYGCETMKQALEIYDSQHQVYVCSSKNTTTRFPIIDINYIEIFGHDLVIHTVHGEIRKYGTLKEEYNRLKKYGFVRCNQSTLIPAGKISEINSHYVYMLTGERFLLSRSCTTEVVCAYNMKHPK